MNKQAILFLALCVSTSAPAQSQDQPPPATPPAEKPDEKPDEVSRDPKAVEILKRANDATEKVKILMYTAEFSGEGFRLDRIGISAGARVSGSFTAAVIEGRNASKFRIDVNYTPADSKETQEFSFGGDGDTFFFIDPKSKTVYEDIDPVIFGDRGNIGRRTLGMREYLLPTPFNDEINGKKVELKGERTVGDVPCHEIHVQYAQQPNQSAHWYFGKKDHLPRGVRRVFTNDQGAKSTVTLMISNLAVNPTFIVDPFTAIVPEGWTKNTDDVAP